MIELTAIAVGFGLGWIARAIVEENRKAETLRVLRRVRSLTDDALVDIPGHSQPATRYPAGADPSAGFPTESA